MVTGRSGHRQAPGRLVLFSYGGRAVKNKETIRDPEKNAPEPSERYKILDYATLLSWSKESVPAPETEDVYSLDEEFSRKQRNLKYLLL